jgi:hypothetical protein
MTKQFERNGNKKFNHFYISHRLQYYELQKHLHES